MSAGGIALGASGDLERTFGSVDPERRLQLSLAVRDHGLEVAVSHEQAYRYVGARLCVRAHGAANRERAAGFEVASARLDGDEHGTSSHDARFGLCLGAPLVAQ